MTNKGSIYPRMCLHHQLSSHRLGKNNSQKAHFFRQDFNINVGVALSNQGKLSPCHSFWTGLSIRVLSVATLILFYVLGAESYMFRNSPSSFARIENIGNRLDVISFTFSAWIKPTAGYSLNCSFTYFVRGCINRAC